MSERKKVAILRLLSEELEETHSELKATMHELNLTKEEVEVLAIRIKTEQLATSKKADQLAASQAEVERLKFENTNLKYDAKQDTFMRHYTELRTTLGFESGISHSNAIQYAKMLLDYKEELKKERDGLKLKCKRIEDESKKRLDDILAANDTLKSREAEAKSYRDLYNELREAVLNGLNLGGKSIEAHSPKEVLHELQCIKNDRDTYKQTALNNIKHTKEAENKYRRLVELLRKRFGADSSYNVLKEHYDNEAKLKAKRGKK